MTPVMETKLRRLTLFINREDKPDSYSLFEVGDDFILGWKLVWLVPFPETDENKAARCFLVFSDGNSVYGFERLSQEAPVEVTNEQETLPS